ncbi:hypothetical protein MY4038_007610 [Beauveria bassiana]
MALIVLVNGVGDGITSAESREAAQQTVLARDFPEADVLVFNSVYDQGSAPGYDYFLQKALDVIESLQNFIDHSGAGSDSTRDGFLPKRIVFVALNIGAALVKQILLLASEDVKHHWIVLQTVALHFAESPSYTDPELWRRFFSRLLSTNKLSILDLIPHLDVLPKALAHLEVQFSAISGSFDQKTYDGTNEGVYLPGQGTWNFQGSGSVAEDILCDIRTSLTRSSIRLDSGYCNLQGILSSLDAAVCRLSLVPPSTGPTAYVESHPSFKPWLSSSGSSILSVEGPPGSDHTCVTSHIMRSLLLVRSESRALFLSFSFHRWDARRNSEQSFVVSAIRQLLTLRPEFYNNARYIVEAFSSRPIVSSQQLWNLLRHLLTIPTESCIFLVVDAVDQCSEQIAAKLSSLAAYGSISVPVRLIVTASSPIEMTPSIPLYSISLEEDSWRDAIRDMTAERVSRITLSRPVWKDFEQSIVEKLCGGHYHTDHDVTLNLEFLEQQYLPSTRLALKQYLSTSMLPAEMFSTTVSGLLGNAGTRARLALKWILHAARPLSISELAVALTLGPGPEDVEAAEKLTFDMVVENVSWDLMRDLGDCLGLGVKIVDGRIMLVHLTFRSYLEAHSDLLVPNFHGYMADRCLSYLSLCLKQARDRPLDRKSDAREPDSVRAALAFREYALLYWIDHYELQNPFSGSLDDEVSRYLSLLVDHSDTAYGLGAWKRRCGLTTGWREDVMSDPLFLASQIGLGRIVRNLIRTAEQKTPEQIGRAIKIAASAGNLNVVQELQQSARPADLALAACAAAEYGHAEVLEDIMANMNPLDVVALMSSRGDTSPLLLATANGHTAVTEILLTRDCDLRAVDSSGNTAVHLASRSGDADTLRALRSASPDEFRSAIRTANLAGMYPLHLACLAGFADTFALVFSESPKALVHQPNAASVTPIHIAAELGHRPIVRTPIYVRSASDAAGTSVSPIVLAAQNGHSAVLRCLVEDLQKSYNNTAEAGAERKILESAFNGAVVHGHIGVVELLLKEMDVVSFHLRMAAWVGHLDVLKALVRRNTPFGGFSEQYHEILVLAIEQDHVNIVRYLVQEGVAPLWIWNGDESSLHRAARLGREFCLREILRRADGNAICRKDRKLRTPLEVAAAFGQLGAFKLLLECENRQASSATPAPHRSVRALMLAIKAPKGPRKVELVSYLLDNGWSAKIADGSQDTPLHVAVQSHGDDIDLVRLILERGADPDTWGKRGETSLHIASRNGHARVVRQLLVSGANPNLVDSSGFTSLHIATENGLDPVVRVLLRLEDEGDDAMTDPAYEAADVEIETPRGWRAIHYAVNNSTVVTATLTKLSPKPNLEATLSDTGATPLILAAENEDHDVSSLLLAAGADPDALGGTWGSALHAAVCNNNESLAELLFSYNASPNVMSRPFGTPLHAVGTDMCGDESVPLRLAKLLLERDAGIDTPDYHGRTPIMTAVQPRHEEIIDMFLSSGANPDSLDGMRSSALHYAARTGQAGIIRRLLEADANVDLLDGCGRGVLYLVALCMDPDDVSAGEVFDAVLAALPETRKAVHLSAAMPALMKAGAEELLVSILDKRGDVDINVPDRSGWTSLDIARCYNKSSNTIDCLQQLGAVEGVAKQEPTRLSLYDRSALILLSNDGMCAQIKEEFTNTRYQIIGSARADHCVPIGKGIYYFEVEVLDCGRESAIAVGLVQEHAPLNATVGWRFGCWGYHSDDGSLLNDGRSEVSGPVYGAGQVVGVAYDPRGKRLWFTLDGEKAGESTLSP